MVESHRSNRPGGGVAICLKSEIEYTSRKDLDIFKDHLESIFVEIDRSQFGTSKNIIIGTIYRRPDTDIRQFTDDLAWLLDKIYHENKLIYLLGDYNINLLNVDTHIPTSTFIDILYSHHLFPLISRPTRITQVSATLIDNIFTNNIDTFEFSLNGILVTDISDHFPIFHINYSYASNEKDSYMVLRVYNEKNKQLFRETIASINWNDVFSAENTQNSFDIFHKTLIDVHNKCFPKTRIKKKILKS